MKSYKVLKYIIVVAIVIFCGTSLCLAQGGSISASTPEQKSEIEKMEAEKAAQAAKEGRSVANTTKSADLELSQPLEIMPGTEEGQTTETSGAVVAEEPKEEEIVAVEQPAPSEKIEKKVLSPTSN